MPAMLFFLPNLTLRILHAVTLLFFYQVVTLLSSSELKKMGRNSRKNRNKPKQWTHHMILNYNSACHLATITIQKGESASRPSRVNLFLSIWIVSQHGTQRAYLHMKKAISTKNLDDAMKGKEGMEMYAYMVQKFLPGWTIQPTYLSRYKRWSIFIAARTTSRERSSQILKKITKFRTIQHTFTRVQYAKCKKLGCQQMQKYTSVTLGIVVCSMKTESCASISTNTVGILSICIESVVLDSWEKLLLLPESRWKCPSSFWKKSWKPSCTQSIIKSLSCTSNSVSPSIRWWNS